MTTHPTVLAAIEALATEIESLRMVQSSAYVALARHLHGRGYVQLPVLANDLRTLASVDADADWQSGHEHLAALLEKLNATPRRSRE